MESTSAFPVKQPPKGRKLFCQRFDRLCSGQVLSIASLGLECKVKNKCTLKFAKMLAAQASAQPFKSNCGTSPISSKRVAPQACAAIIAAQVLFTSDKVMRFEVE